jgi:predicted XRE-type DNA-binding protein
MSEDLTVHTVGENLFEELGLPEAAALQARVDLAFVLTQVIRRRQLTQTQAAALLEISQPEISRLMRGAVEGFSQERLARLLNTLDLDVRIQVRPRAPDCERAGVTVELIGTG